jgi:hypothetical protein
VPSARSVQLAPGGAELGAKRRDVSERVEDVELKRRPREPPLLKLTGHRDRVFRCRRHVLA